MTWTIAAASGEDEIRATRSKLLGERAADSGACARHERPLPRPVSFIVTHRVPPRCYAEMKPHVEPSEKG